MIPKKREPVTEKEKLDRFIEEYIDEKPRYSVIGFDFSAIENRILGLNPNLVIWDKVSSVKPTKKQAKLLKKFRKLRKFK
jgi:hypothetical protein